MVIMETKYAALFSQLYHPLYLLHPSDLSSSRAFPSLPSILPSSIGLVIIVCYLHIITIKKLINLDCLAYYCRHSCFVSIDNLSIGVGSTFNSICTFCKSSSRILWLIKDKNNEKTDKSRPSGLLLLLCILRFYWQPERSSWADIWFNLYCL